LRIVGIFEGLKEELIEEVEATAELPTMLELLLVLIGVTLLFELPVFVLDIGLKFKVYGVDGVVELLAFDIKTKLD